MGFGLMCEVVISILSCLSIILLRKWELVDLLIVFLIFCDHVSLPPGLEVINFSCATQLNMKFQQLIRTKMLKVKTFLYFKTSD